MIVGLQYVWLLLVVFLLAMEAMTVGLTTIWFAGGALVAAIAAFFGVSVVNQILLFVCVSLVLVFLVRPVAIRYVNKGITKTNVNSFVGKKAIVTQQINNLEQSGQVRIGDVEWKARTAEDGVVIPEKSIVIVDEVNGVKLIVHKA